MKIKKFVRNKETQFLQFMIILKSIYLFCLLSLFRANTYNILTHEIIIFKITEIHVRFFVVIFYLICDNYVDGWMYAAGLQ